MPKSNIASMGYRAGYRAGYKAGYQATTVALLSSYKADPLYTPQQVEKAAAIIAAVPSTIEEIQNDVRPILAGLREAYDSQDAQQAGALMIDLSSKMWEWTQKEELIRINPPTPVIDALAVLTSSADEQEVPPTVRSPFGWLYEWRHIAKDLEYFYGDTDRRPIPADWIDPTGDFIGYLDKFDRAMDKLTELSEFIDEFTQDVANGLYKEEELPDAGDEEADEGYASYI